MQICRTSLPVPRTNDKVRWKLHEYLLGLLFVVLAADSAIAQSITVNGSSGPTSLYSGETVEVHTIRGGTASTTDWVGLYVVGAPNYSYLKKYYLNGLSTPPSTPLGDATFNITLVRPEDDYEFRYFPNNSINLLATSGLVTINPPVVQVSGLAVPEEISAETQESVPIDIIGGPGNKYDRVMMYEVGETNNAAYLDWFYLNGSKTAPATGVPNASFRMTLPSTVGDYEFRFTRNNSYTLLGTSPAVAATSSPVTHTITNGTTIVGINLNWGGAITKLSFATGGGIAYKNVVNNEGGPGRQIEAAVYDDADNNTDCWPCSNSSCSWGWNPVQAGSACGTGSGGTVLDQTATKIVTATVPAQWNNLFSPSVSAVVITQTLELVEQNVLKIDYHISNNESFSWSADSLHELPVVYLNWSAGRRAFAYQGDNAFTYDTLTEIYNPCCNNTVPLFDTDEPWVALVDDSIATGSPVTERPATALYVPGKNSNWGLGTRSTSSYIQNWQQVVLGPTEQTTITTYLVFGPTLSGVRAKIYELAGQ